MLFKEDAFFTIYMQSLQAHFLLFSYPLWTMYKIFIFYTIWSLNQAFNKHFANECDGGIN